MLRPGEGNAVILSCGGQSLLLPLGDDEDTEDLEEYLNRQRLSPDRYEPANSQETLTLGDADCKVEQTGRDTWAITVTHAENQLYLRFRQAAQSELSLDGEAPTELNTERHSVRILSDGARFTVRPDFSAWGD